MSYIKYQNSNEDNSKNDRFLDFLKSRKQSVLDPIDIYGTFTKAELDKLSSYIAKPEFDLVLAYLRNTAYNKVIESLNSNVNSYNQIPIYANIIQQLEKLKDIVLTELEKKKG